MYDDRTKWTSRESEHFIYKYLPNSEAESDINLIIHNRELAYVNISQLLGIEAEQKLELYFIPDITTAYELKMMVNASVPHLNFASLLYNDFSLCQERIRYGHEIAHLLVYYWDRKIYHLEILEEGLAVYLDQSGSNKHLDFINYVQARLGNTQTDLTLDVEEKSKSVNYVKAGSFVKFLIETYGISQFKKLYIASEIDRDGQYFKYKNMSLSKNHLKNLLIEIFNKNPVEIQKEWLSSLGLKI